MALTPEKMAAMDAIYAKTLGTPPQGQPQAQPQTQPQTQAQPPATQQDKFARMDAIYNSVKNAPAAPSPAAQPAEAPKSLLSNLASLPGKIGNDVFVQPAIGLAKKVGQEAVNIGELGAKALDAGSDALGFKGFSPETRKPMDTEALKPTNPFQTAGGVVGDALEFLAPAGEIAKGAKAIDTALAGTDFLAGAGRVAGKAGLEAATNAGLTTAQTGDVKQGASAGMLSGALSGFTGILGEAAKASGIPEALYQRIFKNTADDSLAEIRSAVNSDMKTADPAKYKQLMDAGVIHEKDGQAIVNETVAKRALESGLKGSVENMAKTVIKNNYDNELAARSIAASIKEPLKLEPNYKKTLDLIAQTYQDSGLGKVSQRAQQLSSKIAEDGSTTATDSLDIRRFLDGMRSRNSFDVSSPLPLKQENLKELTDALRGKINSLPGMRDVMKSYTFNMDAADALAKEAARRGNNQIIGLLDAGLFGGGVLTQNPTGIALGFFRRAMNSPTVLTNMGNALNKTTPSIGGILGRSFLSRTAFSPDLQ